MFPAPFTYIAAQTLEEAGERLRADEARLLAGGQSLIPLLRFRLAMPSLLVDIGRIADLDKQRINGTVHLGALVTTASVERSAAIAHALPVLHDAVRVLADPLVRERGTVGGNLAHADPGNDLPAVLVATRGTVTAYGRGGIREVAADDLFAGPFSTRLAHDDIVTAITLPAHAASAYMKLKRTVGDYGIAGVAAALEFDRDGGITQAGVALTAVGGVGLRAHNAERILLGTDGSDRVLADAAAAAAADAAPVDDERGSARYKRALVETLTRRALVRSVARAEERR